jgi:hypothetical protein
MLSTIHRAQTSCLAIIPATTNQNIGLTDIQFIQKSFFADLAAVLAVAVGVEIKQATIQQVARHHVRER